MNCLERHRRKLAQARGYHVHTLDFNKYYTVWYNPGVVYVGCKCAWCYSKGDVTPICFDCWKKGFKEYRREIIAIKKELGRYPYNRDYKSVLTDMNDTAIQRGVAPDGNSTRDN